MGSNQFQKQKQESKEVHEVTEGNVQFNKVGENRGEILISVGHEAKQVLEETGCIDEAEGEGDGPQFLVIVGERVNQRQAQKHLLNEAPQIPIVDRVDVHPSLHENDLLSAIIFLAIRLDFRRLVGEVLVIFIESILHSLQNVEFERAVVVEGIFSVDNGVQRGI